METKASDESKRIQVPKQEVTPTPAIARTPVTGLAMAVRAPNRAAAALTLQRMAGNRATNQAMLRFSQQVQRAGDGATPEVGMQGGEVSSDLAGRIERSKLGGSPMDDNTAGDMGKRFGADFSHVRIHTGAESNHLNRSLSAKAFTHGSDVFFSSGAYSPDTGNGKNLLAHELTHVIQQSGGGNGVSRVTRKSQAKLTVGAADDAYEREADQTAQRVLSMPLRNQPLGAGEAESVQRQADSHANGCGCAACNQLQRHHQEDETLQLKPAEGQHNAQCGCAACTQLQRTYAGPEGANGMLQRSPDAHGPACNCSSCGGMRIQTKLTVGAASDPYEQEAERIAAEVVRKPTVARMLGSHLHAPIMRLTPAARKTSVQSAARGGVVQRHSSWEHQLIGDAQPDELAKIGTWKDLINQTTLKGTFGFRERETESAKVNIEGVGEVTKGNVMHLLATELARLDKWQKNPPQQASNGAVDPIYQTVLISVPGGKLDGSPLIITYGEMNTLADYYGNLEVMKSADKQKRWETIQSVRQETFFRLKDVYSKLEKSLTKTEKRDQDVSGAEGMMKENALVNQKLGYKFKDANVPDYISGKAGQVVLLKAGGAGASGTNEYAASLGRNACHFVPESWHAWSSYHQKARESAGKAFEEKQKGLGGGEVDNAKVSEHINEALLLNGFGDHYLQDSYASGHMINKTLIMQWFVQWLDKNKWKMDFAKDANWQKVQAIAYHQPGIASALQYQKGEVQGYRPEQTQNKARNPQAVEDMEGEGVDWKTRFDATGLTVPTSLRTPGSPERAIIEWWQTTAEGAQHTGDELLAGLHPVPLAQVAQGLRGLMRDGIVRYDEFSADKGGRSILSGDQQLRTDITREMLEDMSFSLRSEYMPKNKTKKKELQSALRKSRRKGDDRAYQRMAAAVTYQDYMAFMNNGYLQKSTNALHDVFCLGGLEVSNGTGGNLFKVYGDDSMFNANSSAGVKHSGETAKMSRDAIRTIIDDGVDGGHSTAAILDRLPSRVKPKGAGASVDIAAWHNPANEGSLHSYCEAEVFPKMGIIDKAVGVMGDLSKFISKDYKPVHNTDAF